MSDPPTPTDQVPTEETEAEVAIRNLIAFIEERLRLESDLIYRRIVLPSLIAKAKRERRN